MTPSFMRWMGIAIFAGTCGTTLTSSCGRQPIQSLEETSEELTVEGSFVDWSATANSFAGGLFALMDANTNEVFTAEVKGNHFKLEKIPSVGRYYGLLVGPDFQVRGALQKSSTDGATTYSVFKLGASTGQLGTLVVNNGKLESSQQSELEFQTTVGVSKSPKPGPVEYSTNYVANPDIDGDGVPNMIDTDVDDDGVNNIIDGKTYSEKSIPNSKIPWQYSYANGIPRTGYFKCDQRKLLSAKGEISYNFWCSLKLPAELAANVKLTTAGIEADMFDDGGLKNADARDPVANDGVWNARFAINNAKQLYPEQLIVAKIELKNGEKRSYLTTLGPQFPYTVQIINTDPNTIKLVEKELHIPCRITKDNNAPNNFPDDLALQVLVFNSEGTFLNDSIKSFKTLKQNITNEESSQLVDFATDEIADLPTDFNVVVRIVAPSALPGLIGSAAESACAAKDSSKEAKCSAE